MRRRVWGVVLAVLWLTGSGGSASAGEEADAGASSLVLAARVEPAVVEGETAEAPVPEEWRTVAERSGFRATGDYAQTMDFLRRVAERSPAIELTSFGTSPQGRPLPLVIVSKEGAFTPEAAQRLARERGKPIVLVQNGIHAGEIDGKDASSMILRDLTLGRRQELLDAATLLVIPIYNVDGHERISPYNRPNQNGPVEGMGFRTTADNHDLNRDHLKVVTPEARAVVELFDRWRPHLHVDDHVTDGVEMDWVLTWSWAEVPQMPPALAPWLSEHLPRVVAATEAAGHPTGPYVDLLERGDPTRGFTSQVGEPRYSTGYYALRNRPSILIEMHSYKPYRERVLANRDFLLALLAEIGRPGAGRALIAAEAAAEAATVAAGRPDAAPSPVVLTWVDAAEQDRLTVPFADWTTEESVAMGVPILRFLPGTRHPVEVPWVHRPTPGATAARPRGYLVEPGWPAIERRLAVHGLRVERLTAPVTVDGERIFVGPVELADATYQGETRLAVGEGGAPVERRPGRYELPAGSLWVPADQPDFEVAVQMLEPEAPDSLFAWGLLSTVVEQNEYIEPRVLEPLVRRRLAEEPGLAAEWEEALADPGFAADPTARYTWWYRRTPYWDDHVGRLPLVRVTALPAPLPGEAWEGPPPPPAPEAPAAPAPPPTSPPASAAAPQPAPEAPAGG